MDTLVVVHSVLRWVVLAALLGLGAWGLVQAPKAVRFDPRPFSFGAVIVDIQVLIGIVLYAGNGWYDVPDAASWTNRVLIPYIHPLAMLAALGVVHAALSRARRRDAAAETGGDVTGARDAYRAVGVGYLFSLIVIVLAIPWVRG